jgi:hypothetical protein
MSLSDVNQLALAILSGAGRLRATLLIKTELKYARHHANNATSLCAGVAASWVTSADQVTPCRAARIDEQAARANWPRLQAVLRASAADTPRAERHGRAPDGTGTPRGVAASTGTRHDRVPAERMRCAAPRAAALGPTSPRRGRAGPRRQRGPRRGQGAARAQSQRRGHAPRQAPWTLGQGPRRAATGTPRREPTERT